MKELITEILAVIGKILGIVLYIALVYVWIFQEEKFYEIPTNDLVMYVMITLILWLDNKEN